MRYDEESRRFANIRDVVSAWVIWAAIMLGLLGWWIVTVSAVERPQPGVTIRPMTAVERVGPGPAVAPWKVEDEPVPRTAAGQ